MEIALRELAELVGGRLTGDPDLLIRGAGTLRDVQAGEITLVDRQKLAPQLTASAAAAAVVCEGFSPVGLPHISVANVHAAFALIVRRFRPAAPAGPSGVNPAADIDPTARIAANVTISAGATIGADVESGEGTVVHAGARILAGCRLGRTVTVLPNAVL